VWWPLAPRRHAPLRSLAEGSVVVCCGSSVAARHRGAEEILEKIFCRNLNLSFRTVSEVIVAFVYNHKDHKGLNVLALCG
jgi:hypothetical protein